MKTCGYCGRENTRAAALCSGCGNGLAATPTASAPLTSGAAEARQAESDKLTRGRPRLVIVLGIWAIFLPALLTNLLVIYLAVSGPAENRTQFVYVSVWLALTACLACSYVPYRVIKNYTIHKNRSDMEKLA